ncbi:DHH family phosphoesterase [Halapricum desulfuricans]|uniref:Oligoribonuclease NrnB or cAMP/cGMP phosphodiesterase, DHH superfamily n=1 Tax=Halapricum desulfuricans TaxID=2841257 RepID=A0A897NCK1_9EURY|nr:recombinase RecJ [Halapricum desulfuricans]QSG08126.1 Oligoribonuclease NrnB or cAMP/cGMP phosphodiesterase, DHH superfamily [Halapricum desulfuricans]
MDAGLIDDESLSLERKSLLPGEGFFRPDDITQAERKQEVESALEGAKTVVIADPDADGLACVALVRAARDSGVLVSASPHELRERLDWTAASLEAGADVFVCDLCPDQPADVEPLEALSEQAGSVRWFDHHQWDDDIADLVRTAGVELVVGESDEECSADVALRELDHEFDQSLVELAEVTRDHDLWIREDPRSDDLADFSHWSEPEEYLEAVVEHGADLPPAVEEFLEEKRIEKEALIQKAVDRAQMRAVGPWTVGVTYGRCSQNEVAETLREQGADAAVIVKPAGSASLRGTESFERCHEVAEQVNGGGHPRAAGCKPDVYDDMLDYAHHWTTQGAVAKRAIIDAFRRLAEE